MQNSLFDDEHRRKSGINNLIFGIIISIMVYATFMTQQLTNTYDGLWRQSYSIAGRWEVSLGRWMLPVIDGIHSGLHLDPLTSIMTIIMFVCGFVLIIDLFDVKSKVISFLSMSLFLASTLVSIVLSYRFTSFAYGLSFLVSVLAVYVGIKARNWYVRLFLCPILICVFFSLYQAFLAVYGLVALFFLLYMIIKEKQDFKKVMGYLFTISRSVVIGIILYAFNMSLALNRYHTSLSSYHGADSSGSVGTLTNIPKSIIRAYTLFFEYYFSPEKHGFRLNFLQEKKIMWLAFALNLVIMLIVGLNFWKEIKKGKKKGVLDVRLLSVIIITVLLLPVACNAVFVIAPSADFSLQTTAGMAIFLPLVVLFMDGEEFGIKKGVFVAVMVSGFLILYGNIVQIQLDQDAMLNGRTATTTMAYQIIDDLKERGLLDSQLFFEGCPADNAYFAVNDNYYKANPYAKYGTFALGGDTMKLSYKGLFLKYLQIKLNIANMNYEDLSENEEVKNMPSYPNEGYIKQVGDVVVVRLNQ